MKGQGSLVCELALEMKKDRKKIETLQFFYTSATDIRGHCHNVLHLLDRKSVPDYDCESLKASKFFYPEIFGLLHICACPYLAIPTYT